MVIDNVLEGDEVCNVTPRTSLTFCDVFAGAHRPEGGRAANREARRGEHPLRSVHVELFRAARSRSVSRAHGFSDGQRDCLRRVVELAKLCAQHNVPHIINNAYGVQAKLSCELITKVTAAQIAQCAQLASRRSSQAARRGRVDAYIQSTDKNFLVPVGGAIIAGFEEKFITAVGQLYPGQLLADNNASNAEFDGYYCRPSFGSCCARPVHYAAQLGRERVRAINSCARLI